MMDETEARNFEVPTLDSQDLPVSVRFFVKEPDTHTSEVPSGEWSLSMSSSWNVSADEWKALAEVVRDNDFNCQVLNSGLAVW